MKTGRFEYLMRYVSLKNPMAYILFLFFNFDAVFPFFEKIINFTVFVS